MKYLYYPGCSLQSTGKAYAESLNAVLHHLDVSYEELEDWNCCGATAYMAVDELKAFALAARNLALAEEQGDQQGPVNLLTPCVACYLVLMKTGKYISEDPEIGRKITNALKAAQLNYTGRVQIRHPLDVFTNDIGIDAITARTKGSLRGMKVACYYGCQLVRPYATFDDQHNPMTMDRLLTALGAETIDWPLKTRCCGGTLMGTIEDIGLRLSYIILREAKKRGADLIATACPLCQFNLECYQQNISRQNHDNIQVPVAYFTQLMGMAMGIPDEQLGLQRLFVPVKRPAAV